MSAADGLIEYARIADREMERADQADQRARKAEAARDLLIRRLAHVERANNDLRHRLSVVDVASLEAHIVDHFTVGDDQASLATALADLLAAATGRTITLT